MLCEEAKRIDVVGLFGFSPPCIPGSLQLVPMTRIEIFSSRQQPIFRPARRGWPEMKCFSCGKTGHGANRCPTLDVTFPFILPGWKAEKTQTGFLMISPKMATDRRRAENDD